LNLPITWRIVGSANVEDVDAALLHNLDHFIESPINDPTELTKLYEWADILLVPSYWDGLPLTLMEAARLGVVPIASRVGAIPEVVEHGKTGLLIDDALCDEFSDSAIHLIRELIDDRSLLARLSLQASKAMTRTWEEGCMEFIERCTELVDMQRDPFLKKQQSSGL
jgi:glycosyltransferase involved in cell wall biosynthesis